MQPDESLTPPIESLPKARKPSMHPPEVAARIKAFNDKLGAALVEGLRKATAEESNKDGPAKK